MRRRGLSQERKPEVRRPAKGYIPRTEVAYIDLLLKSSDADSRKVGLQILCRHYRLGWRLGDPRPFRVILIGLLYYEAEKVKRWALNGLALLGTKEEIGAIIGAITSNLHDPDIMGAGVAALSSILRDPAMVRAELEKHGLEMAGIVLMAAAQQNGEFGAELAKYRINLDIADVSELRMATVLLGLNKAPEYLFSLNHSNSNVVGVLNRHPDSVVAQYSVWAMVENPTMSMKNLGIALPDIESMPDNVRGYVYRLATETSEVAAAHHDFIVGASEDRARRAREGLAIGVRQVYFDGIEEMMMSWLFDEDDEPIKHHILEHMSAHAHIVPSYRSQVLSAFKMAPSGSVLRARLEAAAGHDDVALEMRKANLVADDPDLFTHLQGKIVNNTQNFNAPVAVGGISNSGTGNTGEVKIIQHVERAKELLDALRKSLDEADSNNRQIVEGKVLVAEAASAPSKTTLRRVVDWMKGVKEISGAIAGMGGDFGEIYSGLSDLAGNFPQP